MPAAFVRRERKHKRLARQRDVGKASSDPGPQDDPNQEVILPEEAVLRNDRRKQLRADLIAETAQGKVSSKKRKRLDHYIETKLKREENAELIRRLASQHVDTSLLQSSKTLGRVIESKKDVFKRALEEQKAGIDSYGDQDSILYARRPNRQYSPASSISSSAGESEPVGKQTTVPSHHVRTSSAETDQTTQLLTTFGSGLKRSHSHDEGSAPIKRRKRRKQPKQEMGHGIQLQKISHLSDHNLATAGDNSADWQGFESEDVSSELSAELEHMVQAHSPMPDEGSAASESLASDSETDQSDMEEEHGEVQSSRSSVFKQWAEDQRNQALDFTPSVAPVTDPAVLTSFRPRLASPDTAQPELQTPVTSHQRQLKAISIERDASIQKGREALPVVQEEQKIMEAINSHPVVIICGATGSGKTTQVPQMMLESGYATHCGAQSKDKDWTKESLGMIGITQPRRVAAVAVAERVKLELGQQYASKVAHHVRYDTTTSKSTALKFMTDGILLRELHHDFILSRYSAIIVDEAHERSVNTDILIGTLSRVAALRDELTKEDPNKHFPLKLIIMSATLRVADFVQNQRLFNGQVPPIIEAEGRQFNVTIHFARRTQRDYEAEMVRKISKAHRKLPAGTILAFLTGQNEILSVMKSLQLEIGEQAQATFIKPTRISSDQVPLESDDMHVLGVAADDDEEDIGLRGLEDDSEDDNAEMDKIKEEVDTTIPGRSVIRAQILPLYAALPAAQQMQVFEPSPPGTRVIILATNVAETSLTIPDVRYVFDCGRSKEKKYDNATGISAFEVDWISKASASQRTGRAGRTAPGHCWRLYSSALYEEHFPEHSKPEILRTPVESVVLQLKAMSIDNVSNFPFPTPPDRQQLRIAERLLKSLGAIAPSGRLSSQGLELMQYPLNPRFGKILLLALKNGVQEHAIALVAALAVGDIFLPNALAHTIGEDNIEEDDVQHSYGRAQHLLSRWDDQSDAVKMLTAAAVHADAVAKDSAQGSQRISRELYLREKAMTEVQQLRKQLRLIVRTHSMHGTAHAELGPPTLEQRSKLRQIVASSYLDQVAIRADLLPQANAGDLPKARRAIEVAYIPLTPLSDWQHTRHVFVHSSSVLARLSKDEMPSYVVYSHMSSAGPTTITDDEVKPRVRMHPLTTITGKVLSALAEGTPLLQIGKPIGKIEEHDAGKRRLCWVSISIRAEPSEGGSAIEWPLPAWKVEQARCRNGDWELTKVISR